MRGSVDEKPESQKAHKNSIRKQQRQTLDLRITVHRRPPTGATRLPLPAAPSVSFSVFLSPFSVMTRLFVSAPNTAMAVIATRTMKADMSEGTSSRSGHAPVSTFAPSLVVLSEMRLPHENSAVETAEGQPDTSRGEASRAVAGGGWRGGRAAGCVGCT